jgi:predicted RNA-binding Zn-ribbon protein involved in translation (DUF1610 family)
MRDEMEAAKQRALEARNAARPSLDCPTCGAVNVLSVREARAGYQCHRCADLEEGVGYA